MKDDDPEKRIRELERGFSGPAPITGGPFYGTGFSPAPKARARWLLVAAVLLAVVVPLVIGIVLVVNSIRDSPTNVNSGGATGDAITLEPGATFSLGGNGSNDTVSCNNGDLTLNANNSKINVSGHCVSLKVRGFNTQVKVDKVDVIEVSGYNDTITETACNDGKVTLTSYNNTFSAGGNCASVTVSNYNNRVHAASIGTIAVTSYSNQISVSGHCGSLKVSAYNNRAQFDSVDTVDLSGYNNTVTYHTGLPKVTTTGRNNNVVQG